MNVDIMLSLPREAETVAVVRSFAGAALAEFGVTEDCIDDIRLALSEACANVIEHADQSDEYDVHLAIDDDACTIKVIDAFNHFDAAGLEDGMPDGTSARGRGVAIMRAVTDHIGFTSEPQAGTIVRLVKRLRVHEDSPLARLRHRSTRT
jgi:serine/threonine-protein kinase RsbW